MTVRCPHCIGEGDTIEDTAVTLRIPPREVMNQVAKLRERGLMCTWRDERGRVCAAVCPVKLSGRN